MSPTPIELIGAVLFAIALIHTFSTKFFEHLAHTRPAHSGIWHFLGEVEVVFGFWAMVLIVAFLITNGKQAATTYLEQQSFTEPMFVFAIMVIAGSRPIIQFAMLCVKRTGVKLLRTGDDLVPIAASCCWTDRRHRRVCRSL